jgi:hypothetical protein
VARGVEPDAQTEKAADKVIAEKERIVEKSEERAIIARHTLLGRIVFWGKVVLLCTALGALIYFFPVVLPVLSLAGRACSAVMNKLFTK